MVPIVLTFKCLDRKEENKRIMEGPVGGTP
jgi:hypothetical protein